MLPYRDFPFEYPPLAAPAIALPAVIGAGVYEAGMMSFTLALAIGALLLCRDIARRTGGDPRLAMLGVALTPLLLGAVVRLHFDLLPVMFTLAALAALLAGRTVLGFVLIALGAMTKVFPLVVAPVAIAWLVARGDREAALRGAAALLATITALAGAWIALSPAGAVDSVAYHLERPVQIESAPASVLFTIGALGAEPAVVDSHASSGLVHPLAGPLGAAFAVALLAVTVLLTVLAARAPDGRALVLAALAGVAAFAAFGRVLSPQYLLWVVPLLALALAWRYWALAGAAALGCVLTLAEFPSRYVDLLAGDPVAVSITAARNAALVALVGLAAVRLRRDARVAGHAGRPVGLRPSPVR